MALLKPETYKRGIFSSSIVNICGRSVAFVQHWLIGFFFGTFAETDVFFFTYSIILSATYFFMNMTTSVLIPTSINLKLKVSEKESEGFLNSYIYIYAIIGLLILAIVGFATFPLFSLITDFSPEIINDNIVLIRLCLPIFSLYMLVSLLSEILASNKYFTFPNAINFVNSSLGVLFIILFHESWGIYSIAIGLCLGYILNLFIDIYMMRNLLNWNFFNVSFKHVKEVFSVGFYSQLGYIVYLLVLFVPQILFTAFPEGSLTAISFADKLTSIPSIFLVHQITNVMSIKYNNMVSGNQFSEIAKLTEKLLLYVMSGLFVVALVISLLSDWGVHILFGIGRFTEDSLQVTSQMLSMLILYLPFVFVYNIFMRIYNAYHEQKRFLWFQIFTQGFILVLLFTLIPRYGLVGYPIAMLIPYIVSSFCITLSFKRICPLMHIRNYYLLLILLTILTIGYYYYLLF